MKKILIGVVALSAVAFAGEGTNIYLKAGVDISGKFQKTEVGGTKLNEATNDKGGFEFGVEATREILPNFELGLGVSYQDHGKPEKNRDTIGEQGTYEFGNSGYKSLPVYLTAKYNLPLESNVKPYLKADFGYSFNFDEKDIEGYKVGGNKLTGLSSSIDNGIYYGIGGGVEYKNFVVELMYKANTTDVKYNFQGFPERYKKSYDYTRTTLSVGYKF